MTADHDHPKESISMVRRANDVVRAALVLVDDFVEAEEKHLPTCNAHYLNGSPCSCGLPELVAALDAYDAERIRENRRRRRSAS